MFEGSRNALIGLREALDFAPDWTVALIILGSAAALALWLHSLAMRLLHHFLDRRRFARSLLRSVNGPTRLAVVLLALGIALPTAPLNPGMSDVLTRLLLLAVIGLVGWTVIIAMRTAATLHLRRFRLDAEDNLLARKHVTQVRILLRTADVLVAVITVAAALMTFEPVRQYGVSLFASAGVAGLVAGLAARPVLSNLFAGVQLAVAQPIRIDDAVVIENEWGRIEDITSTYVVVRLWDLRRMVVPLTYFIEKPFQNWTREGTEIIASVLLYVDYATPVGHVREKAKEIAAQSQFWNGKTLKVEVSDSKENVMELRILLSANSATAAWDLRCEVREKIIAFLLQDYPAAFPRRPPPPAEPAEATGQPQAEQPPRKFAAS